MAVAPATGVPRSNESGIHSTEPSSTPPTTDAFDAAGGFAGSRPSPVCTNIDTNTMVIYEYCLSNPVAWIQDGIVAAGVAPAGSPRAASTCEPVSTPTRDGP